MSVKVRPYKRGGWEVDIIVKWPDGDEHRERRKAPVSSKSGAKRWGEARERHLLLHGLPEPTKEVPTVREFEKRFIDGYARANRHKASGVEAKESIFRNYLVPQIGGKRLDQITDEEVQRLKLRLGDRKPKTVNNVLSTLNKMLKVAVEWKVVDRMPCTIRLLKTQDRQVEFYDFDEYERLVEGARKADPRIYLVVLLGGDAGLRLGEIVAVQWSDLDPERGYLRVERSEWNGEVGPPKGGRSRRIPMTKRLAEALKAHRHLKGPRVLYRDCGKPLTKKTLKNWVIRAQRRAGMEEDGKVHILRHTFCSHLAMKGAPARAIQELAGHKDLATTQRYMHLSPAAVQGAIRLLEQPPAHLLGDMMETGTSSGTKGQ